MSGSGRPDRGATEGGTTPVRFEFKNEKRKLSAGLADDRRGKDAEASRVYSDITRMAQAARITDVLASLGSDR